MRSRRVNAYAVAALVAALLPSTIASATPPACFSTRVAGETTAIFEGRTHLGTLAKGQPLQILDDDVLLPGLSVHFARIELQQPVHFSALVPRDKLVVFLRSDVEIEPATTWWLRGTPMTLLDVSGVAVRVDVRGSSPGSRRFPVTVACAGLSPTAASTQDGSAPISTASGDVQGASVCWEREQTVTVTSADPRSSRTVFGAYQGKLVRKEGKRTLVEITNNDVHMRVRRWLPTSIVKRHCRARGFGTAGPCCYINEVDPDLHGCVVGQAAPLFVKRGDPPVTTLPAGTRCVWDREHDGLRRVMVRWPDSKWKQDYVLSLVGLVPSASLEEGPVPEGGKGIFMPDYWKNRDDVEVRIGRSAPDGAR